MMPPVTSAKIGIFEGDLYEKLKSYSPDFVLEFNSPHTGRAYSLFDKENPSLIYILGWKFTQGRTPIIVSSYSQDTNNNLLSSFERVRISLREPENSPMESLRGVIKIVEEQFQELIMLRLIENLR